MKELCEKKEVCISKIDDLISKIKVKDREVIEYEGVEIKEEVDILDIKEDK